MAPTLIDGPAGVPAGASVVGTAGALRAPSRVQTSWIACQASSTTRPTETHNGSERVHAAEPAFATAEERRLRLFGSCI
jgi:hypothetical protein